MEKPKEIQLKNGLELVIVPRPNLKTISVTFFVKAGAVDEKESKGVSHFIEHLILQGKDKNGEKYSSIIERLGGNIGAITRHNYTEYFINIKKEHLNRVLKILREMIFERDFSSEEIDREKNVILEEIDKIKDSPEDMCFNLFMGEIYKTRINNFNIVGDKDNIKNLGKKEIQEHYSKFYIPNNCIISLTGNPGDYNVEKDMKNLFSSLEEGKTTEKFLEKPKINKNKEIKIERRDINQSTYLIGIPASTASEKNRNSFEIINNILGGKTDSILFKEFVEKGELYTIYSFYDPFVVGPFILISFKSNPEKSEEVYNKIMDKLKEISFEKIDEEEIKKSKEYLSGQYAIENEKNQNLSEMIGLNKMYGNELKSIVEDIEKTSPSEVNKLISNLFDYSITVKIIPKNG